jgi:hypothetical protein
MNTAAFPAWETFLTASFQTMSTAHPTSYPTGTMGIFPTMKWLKCDTNHSSLFEVTIHNAENFISILPMTFHNYYFYIGILLIHSVLWTYIYSLLCTKLGFF